jgi:prevent-host-death family protein
MSTLTFRNYLGNLTDVTAIPASEAKNRFGAMLERTARGDAVAITKHETTTAVLISLKEFQALVATRQVSLSALDAEFDGLLAAMQTPQNRKGMKAAFAASPEALGKAAVVAVRKK